MDKVNVKELAEEAKNKFWQIGIYGLGQLGQEIGLQLLEWIDLKPDFACDRSNDAIDNFVSMHPDIKKMSLDELLSISRDTLVLICVGVAYIESAYDMLSKNSKIHIVTIDDVCTTDSVLEAFYGVDNIRAYEKFSMKKNISSDSRNMDFFHMQDRVAVYTCITGGYDVVKEPVYVEDNCDYYLISDKKPAVLNVFKWINVNDVVPANISDNAARNRWCKMHGHKIFDDYKFSIYLDGSIKIVAPISHYKDLTGKMGIAVHKHPLRDCTFEEGLRIYANRRGNLSKEAIVQQMKKYLLDGMPRHYGLFECTMIVRDHSNAIGNTIMEQWFDEYMNSARRDQFSFPYILWKNGISSSDIGILNNGINIRKNKDFTMNEEHGT